jgi:23S rRNA U2552 (ribose-2'-O)-methylase RlmE/FtsJ
MVGGAKLKVLLVQFWPVDPDPMVNALRRNFTNVEVTRVDIEPTLNAELGHAHYDLVVFDPATTSVSLDAVYACLRANRSEIPLVVADDLNRLGDRARDALLSIRS